MSSRIIICLLLALMAQAVEGGERYHVVQAWTASDGLPTENVAGLALDGDRQLWLATYDGLVRYQGFDFELFNRSTVTSLPSNRFVSVMPSLQEGLVIRFEGGQVGHLTEEGFSLVGRAAMDQFAVFDKRLWFIDEEEGGLRSWRDGETTRLHGLGPVTALAVDSFAGRLLVALADGSIMALDTADVAARAQGDGGPTGKVIARSGLEPVVGMAAGPDGALAVVGFERVRLLARDGLSVVAEVRLDYPQRRPVRAAWTERGWLLANLLTMHGAGPHLFNEQGLISLTVQQATSFEADRSPNRIEQIDHHGRRWINDGSSLWRDGVRVFQSDQRIIDFQVDPFDQIWITQPLSGLRLLKHAPITMLGDDPDKLADSNLTMVTEHQGGNPHGQLG